MIIIHWPLLLYIYSLFNSLNVSFATDWLTIHFFRPLGMGRHTGFPTGLSFLRGLVFWILVSSFVIKWSRAIYACVHNIFICQLTMFLMHVHTFRSPRRFVSINGTICSFFFRAHCLYRNAFPILQLTLFQMFSPLWVNLRMHVSTECTCKRWYVHTVLFLACFRELSLFFTTWAYLSGLLSLMCLRRDS